MKIRCQLSFHYLFLLLLCHTFNPINISKTVASRVRVNNLRREEKPLAKLGKLDDIDDPKRNYQYCRESIMNMRENSNPSMLKNNHINHLIVKRSLKQFKDQPEYEAESEQEVNGVSEDLEKFADEEDRSGMYDDFESKGVIKRDVSDDYEAANEDEDLSDIGEDDSEIQERESLSENVETKESIGDPRTKRAQSRLQVTKEEDNSFNEADQLLEDQKREVGLKKNSISSAEGSHESKKRFAGFNDQSGIDNDVEMLKSLKNSKLTEAGSKESKADVASASNSAGNPEVDLSKVAEVENSDSDSRDNSKIIETSKIIDTGGSKRDTDLYSDYEKRVEAEIQRKIDAIKEEIKREIERKRRIREIEENNAKFDELRNEESAEVDESERMKSSKVEKRQAAKRVTRRHSKGSNHNHESEKLKRRSAVKKERTREKKSTGKRRGDSNKSGAKKRSPRNSASDKLIPKMSGAPIKKREYVRQVILVDNSGDVKKRRRRSEKVKRDSGESVGAGFPLASFDEKATESDESSSLVKKEESALAKENPMEDSPRLAAEYNEAFGGLQGEPGVSLGRFKRIKRVLRVPT